MNTGQRQIELRGGRLVIYTRADDRHGTWHCRFRLAGKLLRRSLRTKDLEDAKRAAETLYEELSYKARTKQPLKTTSFEQVARDYLRKAERLTLEGNLSEGRLVLVRGTLERYLLPYFGKRAISQLTTADFADYDDWRLDYWTRGYGADRVAANAAMTPAAKTLVMEQSVLRQVLRHGVEMGAIEHLPFMKAKRARTNRRSAFGVAEYRELIRTARRRAAEAKHPRIKRDRRLLEIYVRLLTGTGLRVGEARKLRWNDVELIATGNGRQRETLRLWVDGKTRQVFETNENGERIAKTVLRKQRKWYWRNADGVWLLEVRYGNKALKLSGDKTAVEAGGVEKLAETFDALKAAVKAGELDKQLAAARKERLAMLRKG